MSFPQLTRDSGFKEPQTQYYLIYEGECTEKEYFDGIKQMANDRNMKLLTSIIEITRSEADWFETDIEMLIKMAYSYVQSIKRKRYKLDYFLKIVFDPFCKDRREYHLKNRIYQKYPEFLKSVQEFRKSLEQSLRANRMVDNEDFITDSESAFTFCRNKIRMKYRFDIQGKVLKSDIEKKSICDNDNICVIHDRDYSLSFKDSKYIRAKNDLNNKTMLSNQYYRMIITYPKFELWLVMHKLSKSDIDNINFDYLKNYSGPNQCKLKPKGMRGSENTGPSQYVTDLFLKYFGFLPEKHIAKIFDNYLSPNIMNAVSVSEDPRFESDVDKLMESPGTNVGILVKEMLESK